MSIKRWLIGGAAAVVMLRWASGQVKRHEKKVELFDNLNRWEGEGGNVPAVETPVPSADGQQTYPDAGSTRIQ
jgi:hypothetical protein